MARKIGSGEPIAPSPLKITSLTGGVPHPNWGGWEGFLKTCEVRREENGTIYYGKTNCNYILFPTGDLLENYGHGGESVMNKIKMLGWRKVLNDIKKIIRRINNVTSTFLNRKRHPKGLG